jgi:hypothetical protein
MRHSSGSTGQEAIIYMLTFAAAAITLVQSNRVLPMLGDARV